MSGNFNFNRMQVQEMTMYTVNVPDDDAARLMYLSITKEMIDLVILGIITR